MFDVRLMHAPQYPIMTDCSIVDKSEESAMSFRDLLHEGRDLPKIGKIELIKDYIEKKEKEIEEDNKNRKIDTSDTILYGWPLGQN